MLMGRNDKCYCNSGKKYKNCCLNKENSKPTDDNLPIQSQIDRHLSSSLIKQCVHPNQSACSEKIVKAHSIQNNKILSKVSENGNIYMIRPQFTETSISYKAVSKGRKIATTFSGFCGYHDKSTFQPIEDKDFSGDKQQNFLFSYRAFAFEYHKKREAFNALEKRLKQKSELLREKYFNDQYKGYKASEVDTSFYKQKFDEAVINSNYDILDYIQLEFNGEINIAVCSGFFLEYDLEGNKLNNVSSLSSKRLKMMFLNIFPQNNKTYVLISWLKEDKDFYKEFKNQLLRLSSAKQVEVLNNLIPCYCENTAINPRLWKTFSASEIKEITKRYSSFSDIHYKKHLLDTPQFNLLGGINLAN